MSGDTRRKGWNKITFSACALCALIRAASDGLLQEEPCIQALCFLYSLREKDLLSATYITVFLHYVLQLTCVKKKRMRSAERRGRTAAALNGIGLTRQTLSEPILLCALLYLFIYFSLECTSAALSSQRAREVNYWAEKFGPAEKKRFGPTDKRQKAEVRGEQKTRSSNDMKTWGGKTICFHILVKRTGVYMTADRRFSVCLSLCVSALIITSHTHTSAVRPL